MGNNNFQAKTSINLKEWKLSYIKSNNLSIYNNPTTHQNIQQHIIYARTQSQLGVLLQCYSKRLQKKENVVELKGFYCQQCQLKCSNVPVILLYIEHLPKRLIQIKTLQENEALRILNQILIGFKNLYQDKGFFAIEQKMIYFNEKNVSKVWCNQNLAKNYANSILMQEFKLNQQHQMIRKVIQLIQNKVKKKQIIQRIFKDIKLPFNFQEVLNELNKYLMPVKNKMQKLKMKFPLNKNSVEVKMKIKNYEEESIEKKTGKIKLIKFIKDSNKLSINTDKSNRKKKITIISQYANNNKVIVSSRQRLTKFSENSSVNKNNTISLQFNQQSTTNQKINFSKKVLQDNQFGQNTSYQSNNFSNKTKKINSPITKNNTFSFEVQKVQQDNNRKKNSKFHTQKQQIGINKLKLKMITQKYKQQSNQTHINLVDPIVENTNKINTQNKSNLSNVQVNEKKFTSQIDQKYDRANYHIGKYQLSKPTVTSYQQILDQIKNKQEQKKNSKQSKILSNNRYTNNFKTYSSYQNKKYNQFSIQKFNNQKHEIKKNDQIFKNNYQSKSIQQNKIIKCKQFNYQNNIIKDIAQNKSNKIIQQVNQNLINKINSKLNQNYQNLKKNIDNQQININISPNNIRSHYHDRINQYINFNFEQNNNLNQNNHKLQNAKTIDRFKTQHINNFTNHNQNGIFNIQKEIAQDNCKKNQKNDKKIPITSKFIQGNRNQKNQTTSNQKGITGRINSIQYDKKNNHNFSLQMNRNHNFSVQTHINYKNQKNINHPYSIQMNKNIIRKQFTRQNQGNQIKTKCNFNPNYIKQKEIIQYKYNINTSQKIKSNVNMINKVYINHSEQKNNNIYQNKNQQFYYKNPNINNQIHPYIINNNFAPVQQQFQFKHTNQPYPNDDFVNINNKLNIEKNINPSLYQNGIKKSIIIDNNNKNYKAQSIGHLSSDIAEERMSIYIFQDQI